MLLSDSSPAPSSSRRCFPFSRFRQRFFAESYTADLPIKQEAGQLARFPDLIASVAASFELWFF